MKTQNVDTYNLKKNQRGFTIIELMFTIAIFAMMIPALVKWMDMSSTETKKKVSAGQIEKVGEALSLYVKDNYASFIGSPHSTVAVNTLSSNNYLPSSWSNTTENPWGQTFTCHVINPSGDNLQVLVLTNGGNTLTAKEKNQAIPSAATMVGSNGGFVPTGNLGGESTSIIQGAYGTWQLDFSTVTGLGSPGAGHLAWSKYFQEGQLGEDYLYRSAVPGHPELNQMQVALDMDGNQINMGDADVGGGNGEGVARVNFENHEASDFSCTDDDDNGGGVFYDRSDGLYVCREGKKQNIADQGNEGFLQNAEIASNGDTITKPDCSSYTTPQIFVSPVVFSRNTSGENLKAVQAYAQESGTDWTVHLRVLTKSGWKYPSSSYGRLMVITKCS